MKDYTKDFEEFWRRYPKRWNSDIGQWVKRKKRPAFKKWQNLSIEIRKECLQKVHLIKKHEGVPRDAVTWLNQWGWEDIEEVEEKKDFPVKEIEKLFEIPPKKAININDARNEQMKKLRTEYNVKD